MGNVSPNLSSPHILQLLINSLGYHFSKTRHNFTEAMTGSWSQCSVGDPFVQSWRQKTWDCSTAKSRGLAPHKVDEERKFGWTSSWEQHNRTHGGLSPAVARWRNRWFLFSGGGLCVSGRLTWLHWDVFHSQGYPCLDREVLDRLLVCLCCVVQLSHS